MWLDRLKEMKEKSGLTTREIAEKAQIPEPTLEKLFAGITKDPRLATITQLVHFFGYRLDDLDDPAPIPEKNPASSDNDAGSKISVEQLYEMLVQAGFVREGEDLSDDDLRFLLAVGESIRLWFSSNGQ